MTATTLCANGHKVQITPVATDSDGSYSYGSKGEFCATCEAVVLTVTERKSL